MRLNSCYGILPGVWLLFVPALAAQVSASKACQPFPSNTLYLYDDNPAGVQVGDFNGDGIPDLVALWAKGITVLRGRGDGTFAQAGTDSIVPYGDGVGVFTVGDFNHDGKLDVAVAADDTVYVVLGNGDGTFQPPKTSAIKSAGFLATGDFNHDGNLDLVATAGARVQVLLGNGDGTFQAPVYYAAGNSPSSVAVADFNGDGKLDLAVADEGRQSAGDAVSILIGNGDGTFQPKQDFRVGHGPSGITAADFNGDGKVDIATANYLDGTVSVLLGNGNGTFRAADTYALNPSEPYSLGIAAVQFEPGEQPSLAVATAAGTYTLANAGDGTFRVAQIYSPGAIGVVSGDFNGDGKGDLALIAGLSNTGSGVAVLLGKGRGTFATSSAYLTLSSPTAVAVGDFNGDGTPDLVVGTDVPYSLGVMLGQGHGRFAPPAPIYSMPDYASAIATGDLNGDGKLDLAVALSGTGRIEILLGNGDGTFSGGQEYKVLGQYPAYISFADFNGDGKLDMAVITTGNYLAYGALNIFLGNGDGTFQKAVGYGVDEGADELNGLVIADFNQDGKLDAAWVDNDKKILRVFLGNGDGTFRAGSQTAISPIVTGLAAADFNGDGKLDLATLSEPAGTMQILLGNGDGTFQAGASFPALNGYWLTAADFSGDGKPGLAVLADAEDLVELFPGNGDGTFGAGVTTYSGIQLGKAGLALADLNGDGSVDLVSPNYESNSVSVFLNKCGQK